MAKDGLPVLGSSPKLGQSTVLRRSTRPAQTMYANHAVEENTGPLIPPLERRNALQLASVHFCFFPIAVLVFFAAGSKSHLIACIWLCAASLFFYGWWNPSFLGLLMGSVIFNYAAAEPDDVIFARYRTPASRGPSTSRTRPTTWTITVTCSIIEEPHTGVPEYPRRCLDRSVRRSPESSRVLSTT